MSDSAKWKILAVLALVWTTLILVRLLDNPEPQRVPLQHTSGQVAVANGAKAPPALAQTVSHGADARKIPRRPSKNIFAPLEFPKPKPKRKKVAKSKPPPPPPKPVAAPPAPPQPSPDQLAAAQARKRMSQYRVLGYSSEGGEPRAFLGKGNKIFIARVGEELEDRIQVAAITDTAVKLRETRTRLEATLPYEKGGR